MAPRYIVLLATALVIFLPCLPDDAYSWDQGSWDRGRESVSVKRIFTLQGSNRGYRLCRLNRHAKSRTRFLSFKAPYETRIAPYFRFPRPYSYQNSSFRPEDRPWSAEKFAADEKWGAKDTAPRTSPGLYQQSDAFQSRIKAGRMMRSNRWLSSTNY